MSNPLPIKPIPFPSLLEPIPSSALEAENGLLNASLIEELIARKALSANHTITPNQIQPASLDLRLGSRGFVMPASFLPGAKSRVEQKAKTLALDEFSLDEKGMELKTNCIYLIELAEMASLPNNVAGFASPKSSIGRIDVFTRLICDYGNYFDVLPPGYKGKLWLEISPRSFNIIVHTNSTLLQLRFRQGRAAFDNYRLNALHKEQIIVSRTDETQNNNLMLKQGLLLSVDLSGDGICGFRAKEKTPVIDIDKIGELAVDDFWETLLAPKNRRMILELDAFYILASHEAVRIPSTHAAEMMPFDSQIGEFRAHYAGFFDPGFGIGKTGNEAGAKAVLEMRARETPFVLEHGQIIGRLVFERLMQKAEIHYDKRHNANYQGQGLSLSKHFKR